MVNLDTFAKVARTRGTWPAMRSAFGEASDLLGAIAGNLSNEGILLRFKKIEVPTSQIILNLGEPRLRTPFYEAANRVSALLKEYAEIFVLAATAGLPLNDKEKKTLTDIVFDNMADRFTDTRPLSRIGGAHWDLFSSP